MKKRIFSIIITTAMFFSLALTTAMPIYAAGRSSGYELESKYFIWDEETYKFLRGKMTHEAFKEFNDTSDKIYEALAELTGYKPYQGQKINVILEKDLGGYAGMAYGHKQLIELKKDYFLFERREWSRELYDFVSYLDIRPATYTMAHEIAHHFSFSNYWEFNSEGSAELMAFYAIDVLGLNAFAMRRFNDLDAQSYVDVLKKEVKPYEYKDEKWYDPACLPFYDFFLDVGWDVLKKTYRSYNTEDMYVNNYHDWRRDTQSGKLWDFIDRIEFFSGKDFSDYSFEGSYEKMQKQYPRLAADEYEAVSVPVTPPPVIPPPVVTVPIENSLTLIPNAFCGTLLDAETIGLEKGKAYTFTFQIKSTGTTGFRVRYTNSDNDFAYNDESGNPAAHSSVTATAAGTVASQIPAMFSNETIPNGATKTITVNFVYGAAIPNVEPAAMRYIGLFGIYGGNDFEVLGATLSDASGKVVVSAGNAPVITPSTTATLTAADALNILKSTVGTLVLTAEQKTKYDINSDGAVNTADALAILKIASGG